MKGVNLQMNTQYLTEVLIYRDSRDMHLASVLDCVAGPRAMVAFLLEYCAIRTSALKPVPGWLRQAASVAMKEGERELAAELEIAAEREDEHRFFLVADLVGLQRVWERELLEPRIVLHELVKAAGSKVDRQLAVHLDRRESAAHNPYVMLAAELELAELGRELGPLLVERAQALLGESAFNCLRFVDARAEEACKRAQLRRERLDDLAARKPGVAQWAKAAGKLVESYAVLLARRAGNARLIDRRDVA